MQIQNILLLSLLVSANPVFADDVVVVAQPKYQTLAQCHTFFYGTDTVTRQRNVVGAPTRAADTTPTLHARANVYCSDPAMLSQANYCAGLDSLRLTKPSTCPTVATTHSAVIANQQAAFQTVQAQQAAEVARQQAAAAAAAGSANGAAAGGGFMQMAGAVLPVVQQVLPSVFGGGNNNNNAGGSSGTGGGGDSSTAAQLPSASSGANGGAGSTPSVGVRQVAWQGPVAAPQTPNGGASAAGAPDAAPGSSPDSGASQADLNAAGENARPVINNDSVVDNAQRTSGGESTPTSETEITAGSVQAAQRLQQQTSSISQRVAGMQTPNCTGGEAFVQAVANVAQAAHNYVSTDRQRCTSAVERAVMLCVEQSSPGAQNARLIMNLSGPILGAVNSAVDACSGTAKVTDFVGKVLMVAKGACIAAKVLCDTTCTRAHTRLTEVKTTFTQTPAPTLTAISGYDQAACTALQGQMTTARTEMLQALERDNAPSAGTDLTRLALSQKCEERMADIAAFAGNIGAVVASSNSARECERRLAANGTGSAVTTAAYCSGTANADTQFCKCERNPQQEGCPGYVAAMTGLSSENNELAGANLRDGSGGLSNFAGAKNGSTTTGAANGAADISLPGVEGSAATLGATNGSAGAASPGAAGGAGIAGGGAQVAEQAKAKAKTEEKKWGFGDLASGLGSLFNGSVKAGAKGVENGAIKSKEEAIQRKIASDRLAGEVSSASGKSNWEKVRQQYLIKTSTLLPAQ